MPRLQKTDVDHGFAWVVLSVSFGLQVINGVFLWNTGIITSAILESVDSNMGWICPNGRNAATCKILRLQFWERTFYIGPAAGIYHRKFGPRVASFTAGFLCLGGMTTSSFTSSVLGLLCTFSFVTGCGLAIVMNIFGAIPGYYFEKYRSVAFAVSMTGGGVGMFLGSLLMSYLFETYTFSGSILLLGAVAYHICIAGVIIPQINRTSHISAVSASVEVLLQEMDAMMKTENAGDTHDQYTESANLNVDLSENDHVVKRKKTNSVVRGLRRFVNLLLMNGYIMYNISSFFWSLGESACLLHLPNYVTAKGSTPWEAGTLMSTLALGTIFSKLLAGMAASDTNIGFYLLHTGMMGVAGMITLVFPLMSNTFYLQCVYVVILGLHIGSPNSLTSPIIIDLIGLSNIELGVGIVSFFCGIAFLIGPPLASWIYELTNNYDFTFVFSGICYLISSFSAAAILLLKKT